MEVCLLCHEEITGDDFTEVTMTPAAHELFDVAFAPGAYERTKHLAIFCSACSQLPEPERRALALKGMTELFQEIADDLILDRACDGQKPS